MRLPDWFRKSKKSQDGGLTQELTPQAGREPLMRALSLLAPDIAFKHGLAGPAVAGVFRSDDLSPENFVPNRTFVEILHRVIREHAPLLQGFEQAVRTQRQGSLSIIDLRTPEGPNGNVPPDDIVGAFAVAGGKASAATYVPNPNYRVFTNNGLTRLPGPLHGITSCRVDETHHGFELSVCPVSLTRLSKIGHENGILPK